MSLSSEWLASRFFDQFTFFLETIMALMQCWKQLKLNGSRSWMTASPPYYFHHFSTKSPYIVKVGIPEFLNGVGNGVEAHVGKLETEIGDFQKLLVTRTLRLKKLGIPCKQRKLILKYTHKYRLGLWRPRSEPQKLQSA